MILVLLVPGGAERVGWWRSQPLLEGMPEKYVEDGATRVASKTSSW